MRILSTSEQTVAKELFRSWFEGKNWEAFEFQNELLHAYLNGYSGLLNAPTGSGKTYAMWIPAIVAELAQSKNKKQKKGLKVLWITPLRSLSRDIRAALQTACDFYSMDWEVQCRTGDTEQSIKNAQLKQLPDCLITTPESLHILLARKGVKERFNMLKLVVVDEWHELLGSKRGVQVELGLSRLRAIRPQLKIWGISATIGNLVEAMEALLGLPLNEERSVVIRSGVKKKIESITLLPDETERLPWAGHLGIRLLEKVVPVILSGKTTLVFTNTRSQCEIWYQKLLDSYPEFAGQIAMHHGSLSNDVRKWVEDALHQGILKAVVCTSSLDLGVDFRPVDTVIQIGSPKGLARYFQRAGRSGHQPGSVSRIYFLPTHALEIIEAAALRQAMDAGKVEKRMPVLRAFDVLIQYLLTLAVSDGFDPEEIYPEILSCYSYRDLSNSEWQQVLNFIVHGGKSLREYEEYAKVVVEGTLIKIKDRRNAMRHRLHIGTIVGDAIMQIKYLKGGHLGSIEEYFVSRLKPGDVFWFAGRSLEFIMIKDMTALVRNSSKKSGLVPSWMGGRMSFTSMISNLLRDKLQEIAVNKSKDPETLAISEVITLQQKRSIIPGRNTLLIEKLVSDEGYHLFVYPFEGRMIHEVLASLFAYRLSLIQPISFSIAMNDYGFELLSDIEIPLNNENVREMFSSRNLTEDIFKSVNSTEMAIRKFREIGVISGLVFQGYPGKYVRQKHLQSSTSLIFKVFSDYEPDHILLRQAYDEVLYYQMDEARLRKALMRIDKQEIRILELKQISPFAFPIMVDRLREKLSSEKLSDKIKRMQLEYGD